MQTLTNEMFRNNDVFQTHFFKERYVKESALGIYSVV